MNHELNKLNNEQQEAVTYTAGPLLVIAGAGSGKTRVISHKIAYLINELHYQPKHIVAITFTNKSAKEMKERTLKTLKNVSQNQGLTITTFHALGLKILKEEANHLGYKKNFSIFDAYDSSKVIADIIKASDKALIKSYQNKISLWKNNFIYPNDLLATAKDTVDIDDAKIYQSYLDLFKIYQAVDFDDLIRIPVELLSTQQNILAKWQQKIKYLLVDEYQDTNECQYRLIKLLSQSSPMLTLVGDDDQSIYAWRGANINNLLNLNKDFPTLKVIKLEQNYRSSNTILNAANDIIQNNPKVFEKKLWSNLGHGEPIAIHAYKNDEEEAEAIVRKIRIHRIQNQTKHSDYAILYRGNHQARIFEQALKNFQLPYVISGGSSYFEKPEIKDIIAYLKLIINNDDDIAFIRSITTPKRGIGQKTLEKLSNYASIRHISLFQAIFEEGFINQCKDIQLQELTLFGNFINKFEYNLQHQELKILLHDLVKEIDYEKYLYENESSRLAEKKWNNVLSLIEWLNKKTENNSKTLAELLHNITLISLIEDNREEIESIKLSTLHAAKGLEYSYVYLISCEDGIIPHQESINQDLIDEERRLMYVGITRAKKQLTISYCLERRQNGEIKTRKRSRFLDEIGVHNIEDHSHNLNTTNTYNTSKQNENIQNKLNQLLTMLKQK